MIYTAGGILSKLAAGKSFMSLPFILYYAGELVILLFYAVGWQQFVKRMPLSAAYANKAVTVVWGMLWGVLIFHEKIGVKKIAALGLIIAGIVVYSVLG